MIGENLLNPTIEIFGVVKDLINLTTDGLTKWLGNGLAFLIPLFIVFGIVVTLKALKGGKK